MLLAQPSLAARPHTQSPNNPAVQPAGNPAVPPAVEYRRQARRLRCHLAHDPVGLQWALAGLARRADLARPITRQVERVEVESALTVNSGVREFAVAVAAELDGPVLRYSRRQILLRHAESIGIRRFDANLIIAAVQHRMGAEKSEATKPRSKALRLGVMIGLVAAVQSLIALGAWWVIIRA